MSTDRDDVVIVNSAGSADGDIGGLTLTGSAVLGLGVGATDGVGVGEVVGVDTEEANVAGLRPGGLPGVADEPVVETGGLVSAVANEGHGVVDIERLSVEVTDEDAGLITLPRRSSDRDADGAGLRDGIEEGEVVVRWELGVGLDVGDAASDAVGVRAVNRLQERLVRGDGALSVLSVVGGVAHLVFLDDATVVDGVIEGEVDGGAGAAAGAAALLRVGHARNELLGGEVKEGASFDGYVGLEDGGGGKRPAGAATSLILDSSDNAMIAPVDRLGELVGGLHCEGEVL